MTSLEALALSYGCTVVFAFVILYRGAIGALASVRPIWRSGVASQLPGKLADNASVLRALRIAIGCACLVMATTWFTCAIAFLVLRRAFKTIAGHVEEAVEGECLCDKCQVAKFFTGNTELAEDKLEALREKFDDRCPNCNVDLHTASLCFHQPVERGICISQWDDAAESQELLELMLTGGADAGAVDALAK